MLWVLEICFHLQIAAADTKSIKVTCQSVSQINIKQKSDFLYLLQMCSF